MKKLNLVRFAAAAFVLAPLSAFAALDTAVTAAMGDGASDVKAIGALALVIVIGIAVFKYMKRAT